MTEEPNRDAERPDEFGLLDSYIWPQDALSSVLGHLRLRGGAATRFASRAPVAVRFSDRFLAMHHVTAGELHVVPAGNGTVLRLSPGDLALTTSRAPHALCTSPAPADGDGAIDFDELLRRTDAAAPENDAATVRWTTGLMAFDATLSERVLPGLPDFLHIKAADDPKREWLGAAIHFLNLEIAGKDPGFSAMMARLIEIVFIRAVREWASSADLSPGLLLALADRRISRAITAMRANVRHRWSLDELATLAAMSRSTFVARFGRLMNQTPLDYLRDCRVEAAMALLLNSASPLSEIAPRVGYESEAAFARAFRRKLSWSPSEWRAAHRR